MADMTSHERFRRMFEHREADRVPIVDHPWGATVERWQREGMPEDAHFADFFGLDRTAAIHPDNSPRYPVRTVEETDEYRVHTTSWGTTQRDWKHAASTPEFISHTIVDRESWQEAKERMTPTRDRVNWDHLAENYPAWRQEGRWISGSLWFGFDITHARVVGTERLLMALVEDPEWCREMFEHELDVDLALLDMVWDEGYEFDCIQWPDDMGYKLNQFFSVRTYREVLKPVHRRAVEWAHAKGIPAELHSCGDIRPLIPELVDIGLDGLNPLEVKAGMDPIEIKREYGDDLVLHGGMNAVLYTDMDRMVEEVRRTVPVLKEGGGYIFSSDHSVPSSVSLEDFGRFIEVAKEVGSY